MLTVFFMCCLFCRNGPSEIVKVATSKLGYDETDVTDDDVTIVDFVGKLVAMRAAILPSTREYLLR